MDDAMRHAIEHDCQHLSIAYARTADFGDYAAFANLFTDDAVLETSRVQVRGKAEIEVAHSMSI
ncbi:MAG: nuclear transport factor 2 family protein [Candidatus Tectomicrobia bacterium]|nr:nuclear transport factor 2 family protein [Candidatus Tectomicrobia bacterium]